MNKARRYSLEECAEIARYADEKSGRWVTLEDGQRVFISAAGEVMPSGPLKKESEKSSLDRELKDDKMPSESGKQGHSEGGAMNQDQMKEKISAVLDASGNRVSWEKWANGNWVADVSCPVTKRSLGIIKIHPDGLVEANENARSNFGKQMGEDFATSKTAEEKQADQSLAEGRWAKTKAGQEVAVVDAESLGLRLNKRGIVSGDRKAHEGKSIEVAGRKFTVHSVGSPFRAGDKTLVYLYPDAPRKRQFHTANSEVPDDPMDLMEWEQQRESGRTGELPGA